MRIVLVLVMATMSFGLDCWAADLSSREKRIVESVELAIGKAATEFRRSDFAASSKAIDGAINQIRIAMKLGSADVYDELVPSMKRVTAAQALLELEGVSINPFRQPKRPDPKPVTPTEGSGTPGIPGMPGGTDAGISFVNNVAPILMNRCGRCHMENPKGGFSFTTFAALMKGTQDGVVIFAGDVIGSRMIETIETGDMPRGGGKVPADELKTLKDWILAGAKYDGPDPTVPIPKSGAFFPIEETKPATVTRPTGKETVSFAADVAGMLVENCRGCHIDAMQTQGGLRMDTFAQMLRGGDSGAIIVPGDSAASLLIQKLRGMVGNRMPAGGRPAFSEESIQLISTWIDEGASLDGASDRQPLRVMSQLAWAAAASDIEMSTKRKEVAAEQMELGAPSGTQVATTQTTHFQVFGTASEGTVKMVADLAEQQMDAVRTVVSAPSGEAFFHGKATIFVLSRRYDYAEFSKMVEGRAVPSDWTSHWKFDGISPYVSVVATDRDDPAEISQRLAAPLISLAVASRGGDVPRWFAEGVGASVASRQAKQDRDQKRQSDQANYQALSAMGDAKKFLTGKLTPEQSDRISVAVAASMLDRSRRRSFDQVLRLVGEGVAFDQAFVSSFRVTPEQYLGNWLSWAKGG